MIDDFAAQLVVWRKKAGLAQAELERSIGKSRGYLTHVESGAFAPPKSVTDAIAEALRAAGLDISNEEVWSAAAPEVADPDVRAYYEAKLRAVDGGRCEQLEAELRRAEQQLEMARAALRALTEALA